MLYRIQMRMVALSLLLWGLKILSQTMQDGQPSDELHLPLEQASFAAKHSQDVKHNSL